MRTLAAFGWGARLTRLTVPLNGDTAAPSTVFSHRVFHDGESSAEKRVVEGTSKSQPRAARVKGALRMGQGDKNGRGLDAG